MHAYFQLYISVISHTLKQLQTQFKVHIGIQETNNKLNIEGSNMLKQMEGILDSKHM